MVCAVQTKPGYSRKWGEFDLEHFRRCTTLTAKIVLSFVMVTIFGLILSLVNEAVQEVHQARSTNLGVPNTCLSPPQLILTEVLNTVVLAQLLNGIALILSIWVTYGWLLHDVHAIFGALLVSLAFNSSTSIQIFLVATNPGIKSLQAFSQHFGLVKVFGSYVWAQAWFCFLLTA